MSKGMLCKMLQLFSSLQVATLNMQKIIVMYIIESFIKECLGPAGIPDHGTGKVDS